MRASVKRSTYHHRDLQNALIAATIDLIERQGSWSVREVAIAAGVSSAAPHYHFATREELAAAAAEEGFLRLGAKLDAVAGRTALDPVERLTAVCLAYVRFATDNARLYRAMYSTDIYATPADDETPPAMRPWFARLQQTKAEVFDLFVQLVREGQSRGQLRAGSASDLARVPAALAHGLAREFIDEQVGARINRHTHARDVFTLMLAGLRK